MSVKPIPEGFNTVTPYLLVPNTQAQLDFIKDALGGREIHAMRTPDGQIMHAEAQLGDSKVMLGQAMAEHKPLTTMLYVYVQDVDAAYKLAVAHGGESLQEPRNEFYGDRTAAVRDPNGNQWYLATHVEDIAPEELDRRAQAAMQQGGG